MRCFSVSRLGRWALEVGRWALKALRPTVQRAPDRRWGGGSRLRGLRRPSRRPRPTTANAAESVGTHLRGVRKEMREVGFSDRLLVVGSLLADVGQVEGDRISDLTGGNRENGTPAGIVIRYRRPLSSTDLTSSG